MTPCEVLGPAKKASRLLSEKSLPKLVLFLFVHLIPFLP